MSALIDLGELTRTVPEPPAPPVRRRPVLLLLAVVVTMLAATGSAVPAEPVRRLFSVRALGDAPILLTGDRLYTIDGSGGQRRVAAHDARDGRRLWSTATTLRPGQAWDLVDLPGTVLLTNFTDDPYRAMVAFDAGTGAIRWTRPGQVLAGVPHLRAVLVADPDGGTTRLVDAATGTTKWQGSLGDCGWSFDRDDDPRRLVLICPDGTLSTTDLTDGRLLATRRIAPTSGYAGHDLIVTAGLAVVTTFDGPSLAWRMDGYGLDDLRPRWTGRTLPADNVVVACPPANLCVYSDSADETISAATGDPLGTAPTDRATVEADVPGHRASAPPSVVLVPPDSSFNFAGHEAVVFLTRSGSSRSAPRYATSETTWVLDARPDPAGWRYTTIGQIRGVHAPRCVAYGDGVGGRRLVCATAVDVLTVWSLPDAPA